MRFDWDEKKAEANVKNHGGVSSIDAVKVFKDIWAIDDYDEKHSDLDETRCSIIGLSGETLLHVIFTVRIDDSADEVLRIISARKAIGKEVEGYEESRNRYDI
jgi:uncharacterized protein